MIRVKGGTSVELKVGAVVLASGGFQGNQEMMAQYIGRDAHKIRTVCEGGLFNKGEAIRMAMDIGAKPAGQFDAFHAEPVDPRSNREEAAVMTYPYAILVDKNGKRFVDEGKSTVDEQYEQVARTIFYDLPDHIAYMISDQKMYDIPNYEQALETDKPILGWRSSDSAGRVRHVFDPVEPVLPAVAGSLAVPMLVVPALLADACPPGGCFIDR